MVIMEPVKGGLLAAPPKSVEEIFKNAEPESSCASWAVRFAADLDGVLAVLSGMNTVEQMTDAGKDASAEEAAEADEGDSEELPQAMTPEEIAQLDSSLKANGFSDEERKSLITQVVGAEAALALESRVQAGLDSAAAPTNEEALNKEASND